MSYYSQWYEQSVRQKRPALHSNPSTQTITIDASQPDVTAAQVTVCSLHNRLVYNLEFKPYCEKTSSSRSRSSSYTPEHINRNKSISHTQNDQQAAWKDTREMVYNRTSDRERTGSSQSTELLKMGDLIEEESLWDDWIVKFINNEEGSVDSDDKTFEDWIFDTM